MRNRSQKSLQKAQQLGFETLEPRRVLAIAIFDAATATLEVDFEATDQAVEFGSDGQFVTLDGNADINSGSTEDQRVAVSDLSNVIIRGSNGVAQELVLNGNFSGLNNVTLDGLNNIALQGEYRVAGDLTVNLGSNSFNETGSLTDAADSVLVVIGQTTLNVQNATTQLSAGIADLRGLVNVTAQGDDDVQLILDNSVVLNQVTVPGTFRVTAPTITTDANAQIDVDLGYFRGTTITLGQSDTDAVNFERINFKSTGDVQIFEDTNIELVGANFAENLNLEAEWWITDAIFARTNVFGHASFAGSQIALGERTVDQFNAGTLAIDSETHVSISENSDVVFSSETSAASVNLNSEGDILNDETASIQVSEQLSIQSEGDITLGAHESDELLAGTLSFFSEDGHVELNVDGDLHIIDSRNIARSIDLQVAGNISDGDFTAIVVEDSAVLNAGNSIFLGDGDTGFLQFGTIEFNAGENVTILQDSDVTVVGQNQGLSLNLASSGSIQNAEDSQVNIEFTSRFTAEDISFGVADNDEFTTSALNFNAINSAAIAQESDIFLVLGNSANQLDLSSTGQILDAQGSSVDVAEAAVLDAAAILLGEDADFESGTLQFSAIDDVEIHHTGDLMIESANSADSIRLISDGDISNLSGASILANELLDVTATTVQLGNQENDFVSVQSLQFDTTRDTRIQSDSNIQIVNSNQAQSLEIISTGDIMDAAEATISVEDLARFVGDDIILGDAEGDCFSVTSNIVAIEADGMQDVTLDSCPVPVG